MPLSLMINVHVSDSESCLSNKLKKENAACLQCLLIAHRVRAKSIEYLFVSQLLASRNPFSFITKEGLVSLGRQSELKGEVL